MKRILLVALAVTVALALATSVTACGSSSGENGDASGGSGSSASTDSGGAETITTVEDLKGKLAQDHASADWYGDLTDITLETRLGAPVLMLHVAWDSAGTDWEAKAAKSQAMFEAIGGYATPLRTNVAYQDADGNVANLGSTSEYDAAMMENAFELPPVPTTAKEFKSWLDAVYGPGGLVKLGENEKWYSSIKSIEMQDPGSGATLTVTTSLGRNDLAEVAALQLAMQTTGSPLLSAYGIRGADDYYIGGSAGTGGQPGMNGYFYPTEQ